MARPWAAVVLALVTSLLAQSAYAQASDEGLKLSLDYGGRLLFLRVLDIQLNAAIKPDSHSSSARIASSGVLAAFKKFDIDAAESGPVVRGDPLPGVFRHENHDGKRNRKVEVVWTGQDVTTSASPELTFLGDPPATRAQRLESVGYLTAALRLTIASEEGPCHGSEVIFNGKELSELGFSEPRPVAVTPEAQKLGLTHAVRCDTTFKEIAGYKKKTGKNRNQGLDRPVLVDFARIGADGPWVAVRLQAQTPLGDAVIALEQIRVSGRMPQNPLQSASR